MTNPPPPQPPNESQLPGSRYLPPAPTDEAQLADAQQPPPPSSPSGPVAIATVPREAVISPPPKKRPRREVGSVSLWVLGAAVVTGGLANLALRTMLSSVATLLAFLAVLVTLWLSGVIETLRAKLLAGAAMLVAVWLPIRASDWLVSLNTIMAMGCIAALVLIGNAALPRLIRSEVLNFIDRVFGGFLAPRLVAASLPTQGRAQVIASTIRGVALAAIPVIALAALLASADAVFASALTPGWEVGSVVGHTTLSLIVSAGVLALICIHRIPVHRDVNEPRRPIGALESLIVAGSVALLFAAFAVAQLIAALGGADHILDAQSLTRAEYARTGFFQLLWVATLTLGLLGLLEIATKADTAFAGLRRGANTVVSLLTVVIVVVSIIRLRLYTDAFGQTTLRWYCTAFAAMLGVIFLGLAVQYVVPVSRHWVSYALMVVPLLTLLFVNAANPEARVAEHNLSRDTSVVRLDGNYLIGLSADAWPTILDHEQRVVASMQKGRWHGSEQEQFDFRCERAAEPLGYSVLGFQLARSAVDCG